MRLTNDDKTEIRELVSLYNKAIATGWRQVQALQAEMADGRRARLARLGFGAGEAEAIAALHTRNFM